MSSIGPEDYRLLIDTRSTPAAASLTVEEWQERPDRMDERSVMCQVADRSPSLDPKTQAGAPHLAGNASDRCDQPGSL